MESRELLRELRPNATWWLVEKAAEAIFVTVLVSAMQKIREVSWDWWVMGSLFVLSFSVLVYAEVKSRRGGVRHGVEASSSAGPQSETSSFPVASSKGIFFSYGFLVATSIFVLFIFSGAFGRWQEDWDEKDRLERRRRWLISDGPIDEVDRLKEMFLQIPRPCVIEIVAPRENNGVRDQLRRIAESSLGPYFGQSGRRVEPCQVKKDEKGENLYLYLDQPTYPDAGMVVVDTQSSIPGFAEFVTKGLLSVGLTARIGTELKRDAPENFIRIRVGPGDVRKYHPQS